MKILYIASYYYPINDVSSLRIHSYCKALAEYGNSVRVLTVYPANKNAIRNGVTDGVEFSLLGKPEQYYGSFLSKIRYRIRGITEICRQILREDHMVVLSYHDNFLTNFFVKIATTLKGIQFIMDRTEYPYGYSTMSGFRKLLEKINLSLFDGFIVISKELQNFYSKFTEKIFLLPMTIDPNRFSGVVKNNKTNQQYICLTFGAHNRDGLYDSVLSYYNYLQRSPTRIFRLYLIGDYKALCDAFPEAKKIQDFIAENHLHRFITFTGKLPIEQIPQLLADASCLLTTPSAYISGGFPTKVGEYMLSGTPLVATDAGEIADFLTDGYDSFLCPVGELDCVAEKILFIERNSEIAVSVAENAVKTAKVKFNAASYIEDLLKFITEDEK